MKKIIKILLCAYGIYGNTIYSQVSPFWITQNTNFADTIWGIRCMDVVNPNVVWAIGKNGYFLQRNSVNFTKTSNGGLSYFSRDIFPDTNTYHPISIEGIDGNTAWVTSYLNATQNKGSVCKTITGGATWVNMTPVNAFTANASFADLTCFFTPSIGVIVGDPVAGNFEIYRTTNAGSTWSAISTSLMPSPLSGEGGAMDVYTKYHSKYMWFGTTQGRVIFSTDTGKTFNAGVITTTPNFIVWRLAFRDSVNGLALGYTYSSSANFSLFRTTNGGANWLNVPITPSLGLNGLSSIPGTTFYASSGTEPGNRLVSYSTDDGASWSSLGGGNAQYTDVGFASSTSGYAGNFTSDTLGIGGMFKYNYTVTVMGESLNQIQKNDFSVYPNPNNGLLNCKLPLNMEFNYRISNSLGQILQRGKINANSSTVNISSLPIGIYFITIENENFSQTNRIILQN